MQRAPRRTAVIQQPRFRAASLTSASALTLTLTLARRACLLAAMAAATLAGCTATGASHERSDPSPQPLPTAVTADPAIAEAVVRAAREASGGSGTTAIGGPWHDLNDVAIFALDASLLPVAQAAANALPHAAPDLRTTAWGLGEPPLEPARADLVVILHPALHQEDDGDGIPRMGIYMSNRLFRSILPPHPCFGAPPNAPRRNVPTRRFARFSYGSPSGDVEADGVALAGAIHRTILDNTRTTRPMPAPPAMVGLEAWPAPDPPLPEMVPMIEGAQPFGVGEAMWIMPSDRSTVDRDRAVQRAVRNGWTFKEIVNGTAALMRPGGCMIIEPAVAHLQAHALGADPDLDPAAALEPTFAAAIDAAPVEELAPYIGLALPEQRRRFFDRVLDEGPPDDPTAIELAKHLHLDRGDDEGARRLIEPIARRVWSLESEAGTASADGWAKRLGLHDPRASMMADDWERIGYTVYPPGRDVAGEVSVGQTLGLVFGEEGLIAAVSLRVRPTNDPLSDDPPDRLELFGEALSRGSDPDIPTSGTDTHWMHAGLDEYGEATIELPVPDPTDYFSDARLVVDVARVGEGRYRLGATWRGSPWGSGW